MASAAGPSSLACAVPDVFLTVSDESPRVLAFSFISAYSVSVLHPDTYARDAAQIFFTQNAQFTALKNGKATCFHCAGSVIAVKERECL